MKKLFAIVALMLAAFGAQAQTTINVVAQTCNVALTSCVLQGDGGQIITINPQAVSMNIDGVPYVGSVTSYVPIQACPPAPQNCFRRSYDVTMTFTPTAEVTAVFSNTRSGSGRGGWAWHSHWVFETVVLY